MAGTIALVAEHETRGRALQARRLKLGLTPAFLAKYAGIDRETINRAEADQGSDVKYHAIVAALDKWERETSKRAADAPVVEEETIELDVAGDLNMHITARGPIAKRDELVDSLAKLVAQLRRDADVDKNLD